MDSSLAAEKLHEERTRLLDLRAKSETGGIEEVSQQDSASELTSTDQHPADEGSETLEREQSLALLEQIDAQLIDVDRALKRVESGDYGTCEACGAPIDEERLAARPATRFCIADQARHERDVR